jgi:hypothetical protein
MDQAEKMMRIVAPNLYNQIVTILEEDNIHPYDIEANVIEETSGFKVVIRFGEGFTQERSEVFSYKSIEDMDTEITEFIHSISEECKQVMVSDYFKMMKMYTLL